MRRTDREMAEQRRGPGRPRTRHVEPEQEAGGAGVPWQQMMQQMMQQNQMMAQMMQGMQGQQPCHTLIFDPPEMTYLQDFHQVKVSTQSSLTFNRGCSKTRKLRQRINQ